MTPRRAAVPAQFLRFVLTGGTAAVVNVLCRMALSSVTSYTWSIVIAYLVGMTTAYLLMKAFVFGGSGRMTPHEYLRFGLVNVIALAQVWAVSMALARIVFPALLPGIDAETPSHIIGVLSPVATSFLLHKHFTFRSAAPSSDGRTPDAVD